MEASPRVQRRSLRLGPTVNVANKILNIRELSSESLVQPEL